MRLDEVDNVADDEQFSDGLAAGESLADVEFDACTFTGGSFVRAHLVRVTFTVGPGVSPGQPLTGCQRVVDCHHRFGIAPTPEHVGVSVCRPLSIRTDGPECGRSRHGHPEGGEEPCG